MNSVQVVGGDSIKWFGNRVIINGVEHRLYRVRYHDGSKRDYYAQKLGALDDVLHLPDVRQIEIPK